MKLKICTGLFCLTFLVMLETQAQTYPPGITATVKFDMWNGACRQDNDVTVNYSYTEKLYYITDDTWNGTPPPPKITQSGTLNHTRLRSTCLDYPRSLPSNSIVFDNLRFLPTNISIDMQEHVDEGSAGAYDDTGGSDVTQIGDFLGYSASSPSAFADYLHPYYLPFDVQFWAEDPNDHVNLHDESGTFGLTMQIPQIQIFTTYADPGRTKPLNRFCAADPIYVDTYYKTNPLLGVKIEYHAWVGRYFYSPNFSETYTTSLDNVGNAVINPWVTDIADTTTLYLQCRIVSDRRPIRGVWSPIQRILLYPKVRVDMTGIDSTATLSSVANLIETSTDNSFKIQHVSCAGRNDGKITINALKNGQYGYYITVSNRESGETTNYKILRDPTSLNPIVLPDSAIQYTTHANNTLFRFDAGHYEMFIQYLDVNKSPSGCAFPQKFVIKEPDVLQANISKAKYHQVSDVSCFKDSSTGLPSADGRILVNPVGGIGPFDFILKGYTGTTEVSSQSVNSSGSYQFSNLPPLFGSTPIDYQITFTDASGCVANNLVQSNHAYTKEYKANPSPSEVENLRMIIPSPIIIDEYDVDSIANYNYNIRCYGGNADTQVKVSGGAHKYNVWIDGNGLSNYQKQDSILEVGPPLTFSALTAGNYTVKIIDRNSCSATQNFNFIQPTKLAVESSVLTSPACFGNNTGSILINGSGGVPLPGGQRYRYTLIMNTPPPSNTWPDNFSPTPPDKRGEEVTFTNLLSGAYTITISDTSSCQQAYPFVLTEPVALSLSVMANEIVCYGDASGRAEATVGGGMAPYTLQWLDIGKNNITSVSITNTGDHVVLDGRTAGQYYARLIDSHSCVRENVFIIAQPQSQLDIIVHTEDIQSISCHGANDGQVTLQVSGGWQPYVIGRSKTGLHLNAFSYTGLTPGLHRFYVKDLKGCMDSVDVTIAEPVALAAIGTSVTPVSCSGGTDGSFAPQITGGTPPYDIYMPNSTWVPAGFVNGLTSGTKALQARDAHGCITNFAVTIDSPMPLSTTLVSSTNTRCGEASGIATISIAGGNKPYTVVWSLNGQPVSTNQLTATGLHSGVYNIQVTDSKNCQTSQNVGISDSNAPAITMNTITPVKCAGGSDGAASIVVTGGTLPYKTINWTNGQNGLQATGLTAGSYFVSIKDHDDCLATKQVDVPEPPPLQATFDAVMPHCYGEQNGSLKVETSGGTAPYHYQWTATNTSDHIEGISAGEQSVTITDFNNCVLNASYELTQPAQVEVDLGETEYLCTGQTVKLDAGNPGASYQWKSTNGFSSNERVITAGESGTYTVAITSPNGCRGTSSITLVVDANILQADFIAASEAIAGDTVVLINVTFPLPDSSYWNFPKDVNIYQSSDFSQEVIFPAPGSYEVSLAATKGDCFDQMTRTIIVDERKDNGKSNPGGRHGDLITKFQIHPNPSHGKFDIDILLRESSPVVIEIFSVDGSRAIGTYKYTDNDHYEINSEIDSSAGVYSIFLKVGNEKQVKRIIIY